jgi:hypothetical protein
MAGALGKDNRKKGLFLLEKRLLKRAKVDLFFCYTSPIYETPRA